MSHPLFTDLIVEKKDFREAPLDGSFLDPVH